MAEPIPSKTRSWLLADTRAVVRAEPRRRTVVVHRPGCATQVIAGGESLDLDDVLPGFSPPLNDLLACSAQRGSPRARGA